MPPPAESKKIIQGLPFGAFENIIQARNEFLSTPTDEKSIGLKLIIKLSVLELEINKFLKERKHQTDLKTLFLSKSELAQLENLRLSKKYYERLIKLLCDTAPAKDLVEHWNESLRIEGKADRMILLYARLNSKYPERLPSTYDQTLTGPGDRWSIRHNGPAQINVLVLTEGSQPSKQRQEEIKIVLANADNTLRRISGGRFGLKLGEFQISSQKPRSTMMGYVEALAEKAMDLSGAPFTLVIDPKFRDNNNSHGYYFGQGLMVINEHWLFPPIPRNRSDTIVHEVMHGLIGYGHSKDLSSVAAQFSYSRKSDLALAEKVFLGWK